MSESAPIRVMCVDDHPLFMQGIEKAVAHEKDLRLAASECLTHMYESIRLMPWLSDFKCSSKTRNIARSNEWREPTT
jgi:hypothetical protein